MDKSQSLDRGWCTAELVIYVPADACTNLYCLLTQADVCKELRYQGNYMELERQPHDHCQLFGRRSSFIPLYLLYLGLFNPCLLHFPLCRQGPSACSPHVQATPQSSSFAYGNPFSWNCLPQELQLERLSFYLPLLKTPGVHLIC